MKKLFITTSCLLFVLYTIGQDSTKKWQPSAGLHFTSVPTIKTSGGDTIFQSALSIAPFVSLRSRGGFGFVYSPAFVAGGAGKGIYLHVITIGCEQYDKKNFDFVADFTHFFFTGNASVPYTPINNEIILEGNYKKSWLRPRLSAGVGFGTNNSSPASSAYDIELSAGINHSFDWDLNNTSISFSPSLLVNAGTNEYFSFLSLSKYISHSSKFNKVIKNSHARNNRNSSSGSQTISTTTKQSIAVTNIEANIESSLELGSFSIRPAGSLFIPVSSASAGSLEGYWEISINYNF